MLEIPARYISGYIAPREGEPELGHVRLGRGADAGARLGRFDAAHDLCADAHYVRVAVGFDAASAAPFRTSHSGAGVETVTSAVRIEQAVEQGQTQSQRQ